MSLLLGRWEDVLADVETVDAVITDPPYGERTHAGHNGFAETEDRAPIAYNHWTPNDVARFVAHWAPRTRGWIVALTSHDLIPAWERAHEAVGRYCFAPVPCVIPGMSVRLAGDGPSSWAVYAMVSRPRTPEFARWGTLPGAYYIGRTSGGGGGGRGKPIDLMRALVGDYSRRGDLVCDPCAGFGSTLYAARAMGRRWIGAEVDPQVHAVAVGLLGQPVTADLFDGGGGL